jgi:O-antigen ligase
MAICLPAFFRTRWRWLIPVPLAGLVMAESLVGVAAIATVGCVYYWLKVKGLRLKVKKAISLALIIVVVGVGYAVFLDKFSWEGQKNSRVQTWKESTIIALKKPLTGWGYGQFCAVVPLLSTPTQLLVEDRKRLYIEVEDKKAFLRAAVEITGGDAAAYYMNKKYPQSFFFETHNEYIEVLFAAGIPGFALLLIALARSVFRGSDRKIAYLSTGCSRHVLPQCVWFIWQIVPIAVITVVWAGLCLKKKEGELI